jgi:hypothetical protein
LRRHNPQICRAPAGAIAADRLGLIGLPVFHREGVGHHTSARPHLQDLWAQPHVDRWQQEHGDDLRLREVGLEQVGLDEGRLVGDVRLLGVALREFDHVRVVLDTLRAGPPLRSGDDRTAVP